MSARAGGVARASGLIAGVTLASRLVGFLRWLVFAATVGAGAVGTAYSTANSVPNVLYEVAAGGALAAVVVPVVGAALAEGRRQDVDRIASALLTWTLAVLVPLSIVLWVGARPVAAAMTGDSGIADLTATMLRWFAPQVPLYGVGIVATGVLQAHRRFTAAAVAPLLSSLVVVAVYLLYGRLKGSTARPGPAAVTVLAAGTTLGVVALSLPLLAPLVRTGVRLRPTLHLPAGLGRRVWSLTSAGIVALLAQQLAVLATIRVANAGEGAQAAGALNVYQYGQAVYLLPYAVLAVPVATAVFPALAGEPADDGRAAAAGRLAGALRAISAAAGLGSAVLLAASGALGRFFAAIDVGRHVTGALDVGTTMSVLVRSLVPGLLGFSLAALLTRALYVRGRPRTASLWVALGWLVAAALPLALALHHPSPEARLRIIGVSSSVGMSIAAAGLLLAVRSAWPRAALAGVPRSVVAAFVGGHLGGLAGLGVDTLVGANGEGATASVLVGVLDGVVGLLVAALVLALADRSAVSALATRVGGRRS